MKIRTARQIAITLLSVAVAASCSLKEDASPQGASGTLDFSVTADFPELKDAENGTRISLDSGFKPHYVSGEKMKLLIGNTSSTTAKTGVQATLTKQSGGVFTGTVDMGAFTTDDISYISISPNSTFVYYNASGKGPYMRYENTGTQTQAANGVFGDNYAVFAKVAASDITMDGDKASVDGIDLQWGHAILRVNVYGRHPGMAEDEVFKSIKFARSTVNKAANNTSNAPMTVRINLSATGYSGWPGSSSALTLALTEQVRPAATTRDNGIVLWGATFASNAGINTEIGTITVTTDKAVYTKTLGTEHSYKRSYGDLHRWNINLANGFVREMPAYEKEALLAIYEAAGGSDWTVNSGWDSDDITTWYGVTISDGTVTGINLSNNNLTGSLPDVFDKLPGLKTLNLSSNSLTGELPQSLKDMTADGFLANLRFNDFETTTFKVPENRIETVGTYLQVYPQNNFETSDFRLFVDSDADGTGPVHPNNSAILSHAATAGEGIGLYIIGEGYDEAECTVGGTADYWYKVAENAFFSVPPLSKLKHLFNVYYIYAYAAQKGVSMNQSTLPSRFSYVTNYTSSGSKNGSETIDRTACYNTVRDAVKALTGTAPKTPCVIQFCVNSTHNALGGGVEYSNSNSRIGICQQRPSAFRGLVRHETGGHAFGYLLDEYTGSRTAADLPTYQATISSRANTDTESDPTKVKWAQFIADPRYAGEDIGVYGGAYNFTTTAGVYRPSKTSIMYSTGQSAYNAPSRAEIYRRAMTLAYPSTCATPYVWDYESFVKFDLGLE